MLGRIESPTVEAAHSLVPQSTCTLLSILVLDEPYEMPWIRGSHLLQAGRYGVPEVLICHTDPDKPTPGRSDWIISVPIWHQNMPMQTFARLADCDVKLSRL